MKRQAVRSGQFFTNRCVKKRALLTACKALLWVFALSQLSACGTIFSLSKGDYGLYSGVILDFETIRQGGLLSILAVIDLPLSFALDTLLLPISLTQ